MPTSSFLRFEGDYYGNFILDLASSLSRLGLEITVLAPRSRSMKDLHLNLDVKHFSFMPSRKLETLPEQSLRYASIKELPQLLPYLISAYTHVIKLTADVIHAQFTIPMGFIAALRPKRAPLVVTCHGSDCTLPYTNSVYRPFARYALKKADRVVAVSRFIRDTAVRLGAPPERLEVIYQGVNTEKFRPPEDRHSIRDKFRTPANNIVIGTMGRLVPEKRVEDIIKAATSVSQKIDVHFLVGGDGFHRTHLEKLARDRGVESISFLGAIRDPVSFYQLCDVFVLTSEREGLSLSLQEAMASGCVPVAVNGFGCPELVMEGVNGYLFEPRNVEDLVEKILQAVSNLGMGVKARDTIVQRFDQEKNARKYVELYFDVV
jgi:glycosyltransferase involved in cell wall biosynthesis